MLLIYIGDWKCQLMSQKCHFSNQQTTQGTFRVKKNLNKKKTINKKMLKVRIKIKDRNKTEMSERIKKKCMHVHVITHMILAHSPLLVPFRFR